MVWSTEKFKNDNPKTYKAVFDALDEATKFINNDKRAAAEIYVAEGGGKENIDFILSIMNDPQIKFTITPETILPFAQFMNDIGTLKNRPTSWKELFFDNVHSLNGS
jgi:NitT/TauT family transport system substrate-binding protein